jgi:hypothetical protein
VPEQVVLLEEHTSLNVAAFPSLQVIPAQAALALHDIEPGVPLEQAVPAHVPLPLHTSLYVDATLSLHVAPAHAAFAAQDELPAEPL